MRRDSRPCSTPCDARPAGTIPPYTIAWAITLAATFALAIVGRELQHWIESLGLLRWFGVALISVLAIALAAWLIRAAIRLPYWRTAVIALAAGALLAYGATFERPEETMHIPLFGLIGVLATKAFGVRAGLPVVALCAGADELLQLYLPDRVGDWPDVRKNTLSGAVGWLIARVYGGGRNA